MAESFIPVTTSNLSNQTSITNAIDQNFAALQTILNDVLARGGTSPNTMQSVLDMNSNQIINLPSPATAQSPARLQDLNSALNPTPAILSGSNVYTGSNSFTATTNFNAITATSAVVSSITINGYTPRIVLTAPLNLYVDVALGNDSNSGLSSGAGAFKTIQHAVDTVATKYDLAGQGATINLSNATYTENVSLGAYYGRNRQGHSTGNPVTILGSSTVIAVSSGNCITAVQTGGFEWILSGLIMSTATGGQIIEADAFSWVVIGPNMNFNGAGGGNPHMAAINGGIIEFSTTGYTISGGGGVHLYVYTGGKILCNGSCIATLTGVPGFGTAFAYAYDGGQILLPVGTYSTQGFSGLGPRYSSNTNGVIDTAGGGANFFPGNTAGSTSNGGIYV